MLISSGLRIQYHRAERSPHHVVRAVLGVAVAQVQLGLRSGMPDKRCWIEELAHWQRRLFPRMIINL